MSLIPSSIFQESEKLAREDEKTERKKESETEYSRENKNRRLSNTVFRTRFHSNSVFLIAGMKKS